ncbi:hypothetical protein BDR03DRAFT_878644 [Suillus americanus]|nr:hypothetical protein BDR03DRAFT_878644 [Suillus americanus]
MYRKISRDVKLAAINIYEHQHLSLQNIPTCVRFLESTFWHVLKLWHETGNIVELRTIVPSLGLGGRPGPHFLFSGDSSSEVGSTTIVSSSGEMSYWSLTAAVIESSSKSIESEDIEFVILTQS